jgi:Fic family protein
MHWNWEQKDWPNFRWDCNVLAPLEAQFIYRSGMLVGSTSHFDDEERASLIVDTITGEAVKTSEIEGDILDRDSVQSSILRIFGLGTDKRRVKPAERGIAEMMVDLHKNFSDCLSHQTLYRWHSLITSGRDDLIDVGRYRTSCEPMQVISGPIYDPKNHFEAPPSSRVKGGGSPAFAT